MKLRCFSILVTCVALATVLMSTAAFARERSARLQPTFAPLLKSLGRESLVETGTWASSDNVTCYSCIGTNTPVFNWVKGICEVNAITSSLVFTATKAACDEIAPPENKSPAELIKMAQWIHDNTHPDISDFQVGAIIAIKGKPIVWGRNNRKQHVVSNGHKVQVAHGERNAIQALMDLCGAKAGAVLQTADVFSSVQPCQNCAEAILGVNRHQDKNIEGDDVRRIMGSHPLSLTFRKSDTKNKQKSKVDKVFTQGVTGPNTYIEYVMHDEANTVRIPAYHIVPAGTTPVPNGANNAARGALVNACPQ